MDTLANNGFIPLVYALHGEEFYQYRQGKYGFNILSVNDSVLWQLLTFKDDKTLHYDFSNELLNKGFYDLAEVIYPYCGQATVTEIITLKNALLSLFSTIN